MSDDPFIHRLADCQSTHIGARTKVWQFVVILPGAQIGSDCNINAHCFVENDVVIGNRVTIKCGVYVWDGLRIEDDVFIGPNATLTNDKLPRSMVRPKSFPKTLIRTGVSVGAGAVLLPGLEIGAHATIAAGAVVTKNVPANALVVGCPARVVKHI